MTKKETENISKIISVRKKQQYKLSQRFKPFIDHYHGYTIEEIIHDKNIKNKEDFKNSIPILYRKRFTFILFIRLYDLSFIRIDETF